MKALERAAKILGGQGAVAEAIKAAHPDSTVKQQTISYWLKRNDGRLPAEYCVAVEYATALKGNPVTRYELRPDVFGALGVQATASNDDWDGSTERRRQAE